MNPSRSKKRLTKNPIFIVVAAFFLFGCLALSVWFVWPSTRNMLPYKFVSTIAGVQGEFGEPFGVAVKGDEIYISDGQNGKIWVVRDGNVLTFADGLETPSGIAFDADGNLLVADSGSHTIKSINAKGEIVIIAGIENRFGFADGEAKTALFNAPVGIAAAPDGRIYVADTYNDRIRLIENGSVSTLAGESRGYSDGAGSNSRFDTPTGVATWHDKLLVADTGNNRIRVVEPDGRVWTLAGNGESGLTDGTLYSSSFVQPTGVAVNKNGAIFVTVANAIRKIGGGALPLVATISAHRRGLKDGTKSKAQFNRPSGLAVNIAGDLIVADSENRLLRRFTATSSGHQITEAETGNLQEKPQDFRLLQPARWPFDPPTAKRDVAGTLGEIRGEITNGDGQARFHNGLDIAGGYGEIARFVRDEKVLRSIAAENFDTLRELLRMPTLGYIHIRLGRDVNSNPFDDERFQFEKDEDGKVTDVRVRRGTRFKAGEPIGTLNAMNHVHLIAGRSGSEMNALDALTLPNLTDSRFPTIEKVTLFDENWREIETRSKDMRIKLSGRIRVVAKAYDQTDGNSERRRLGLYRLGYALLKSGTAEPEIDWTISFERFPASESVSLVYASGSRSGATGETIFNYIVTNRIDGNDFSEDFINTDMLEKGIYTLRVFAADYFGNITSKDTGIEIVG